MTPLPLTPFRNIRDQMLNYRYVGSFVRFPIDRPVVATSR